jgi:hypothetical protein
MTYAGEKDPLSYFVTDKPWNLTGASEAYAVKL